MQPVFILFFCIFFTGWFIIDLLYILTYTIIKKESANTKLTFYLLGIALFFWAILFYLIH